MNNGRASVDDEQISNAARWAMSYLRSYCHPGSHTFRDAGPGDWEWCTKCYKEQRRDGTSCMICDLPGTIEAELRWPRRRRAERGMLCSECRLGLLEIEPGLSLRTMPHRSGRRAAAVRDGR
ncbi:MAG: hypothetical protein M0R74_01315 [Dehalococcoidia bacterium]|nr:hypothetical protein [Dehalococcoidia bacterium]